MRYSGLELDQFQIDAISGLGQGDVVVVAPTGTGKTLVADWAAEQALLRNERVIYTCPIKSLANQKFSDFSRQYGEDKVGLVTGDVVINRSAQLTFMTTEILRNMLLAGESLAEVGLVVFDEIHFLDDPSRGMVWEECLILLPLHVKLLGLSATVPNAGELVKWLKWLGRDVELIVEERRAVELELLSATEPPIEKRARYRVTTHAKTKVNWKQAPTLLFDVGDVIKLDPEYFPILVFAFSRRAVEEYAIEHAARFSYQPGLSIDRPDIDSGLVRCLERGIGFHHAGLTPQEKLLVEELLVAGHLKVVYCTETFAVGVNYPMRSVIIVQGEKYDGVRVRPLKVREVHQLSGRAGRRGIDEKGTAIVYVPSVEQYTERTPEPLQSQFNYRADTVLWHNGDEERLLELLRRSFLHYVKSDADQAAMERLNKAEEQKPLLGRCHKMKFGCGARVQHAERTLNYLQSEERGLRAGLLHASEEVSTQRAELFWLEEQKKHLEQEKRIGVRARCSRRNVKKCRRRLREVFEFEYQMFRARIALPTNLMKWQLRATIADLRELGYIDDSGVTGKGECARLIHVQTVFLTELYFSGVLRDLHPAQLAAFVSGVDADIREASWLKAPWPKRLRKAVNRMKADLRVGAVCSETVSAVVGDWLRGSTLSRASQRVMDPGDLYNYVRRGIDILQQLGNAFREDSSFVSKVHRARALLETEETVPVWDAAGTGWASYGPEEEVSVTTQGEEDHFESN